jgi:lipooligosaccharide transport system ATP-binding protein
MCKETASEAVKLGRFGDRIEALADRVLVYTDDGDATMKAVAAEGFGIDTMFVRRASLEDVFLILTGRTLED